MDKNFKAILKSFLPLFFLLALIAIITIVSPILPQIFPQTKYYEKTGKVVNVNVSAGGYATPNLTTVYFEDGIYLVFVGTETDITIGKTYYFRYHEQWRSVYVLDELKEI